MMPFRIELESDEKLSSFILQREMFSRGFPVSSSIAVCPLCFSVWARLSWEPQYEPVFEAHVPQMVSCAECKWRDDYHPVHGSLLHNDIFEDAVDWELLELLPPELVRREFQLTLESI